MRCIVNKVCVIVPTPLWEVDSLNLEQTKLNMVNLITHTHCLLGWLNISASRELWLQRCSVSPSQSALSLPYKLIIALMAS